MKSIVSVVLSGGGGTRLWPASRESHPKPFVKLLDDQTLIEKTYARSIDFSRALITVTNRDYYFMSKAASEKYGSIGQFLLEPFSKNTAPAITIAAMLIDQKYGPEAVMLVLPSDHLINDFHKFKLAISNAEILAKKGYLVTFGIKPTRPEPGFGYIEIGEKLDVGNKILRFIEKPELNMAKEYFSHDNFLWNSGIFCFKSGVLLTEMSKYAPEVYRSCLETWKAMNANSSGNFLEISPSNFAKVPDLSIDYAVMEHSDKVATILGDFGWSDIGSWNAVRDLIHPDLYGNRAIGEVISIESKNTFVHSENRLVATVGTSDLMIIDTPDALLVVDQGRSQDVRKVVEELRARNHSSFKFHRSVSRPWGTYTVLEEASGFKIKKIEVKPGASLSLQKHLHRSEHWVVVSGVAKVTNGVEVKTINVNESTFIPAGQKHRLENPGEIMCVMIEVQCGKYLGEDDIVRYEDLYGR